MPMLVKEISISYIYIPIKISDTLGYPKLLTFIYIKIRNDIY